MACGKHRVRPAPYQRQLLPAIRAAGQPHGRRLAGYHALELLCLETSYRDMPPGNDGLGSSLDRFIRLDEGDFIGKAAALVHRHTVAKHA